MPDNQVTAADTVTPWYLDKGFILTVLGVLGPIVASLLGVHLNTEAIASDIGLVGTFVIAHKVKSGMALLALIKTQAQQRYVATPAGTPAPVVAAALDAAPKP